MKKFDLVQYVSNQNPHHRRFGIIVTDPIEIPFIPDHAGASPGSYNILDPNAYDMFHGVLVMDVLTHEHIIMNPSNLIKYEFDFYDSFMFGDNVAPLRTIANCIEELQKNLVDNYHKTVSKMK